MAPATRRILRIVPCAILLAVLASVAWIGRTSWTKARIPTARRISGTLLIAGGGVLPMSVRERFIELAGGPKARLVVIPAFEPDDAGSARLRTLWKDFEVETLTILSANTQNEANSETFSKPLQSATGVWLGGGTQAFLAARYVDTQVERELSNLLERGGVVGGTSAGASVMTRRMILDGRQEAILGRGLGLLPDAVIDQHFLKRNRLTRLIGVLQKHPDLVGFGIDERTALQFHVRHHGLSVVGESYVMAVVPGAEGQGPRLEILKPGDEITLEGLRDPKIPVAQAYDFEEYLSE